MEILLTLCPFDVTGSPLTEFGARSKQHVPAKTEGFLHLSAVPLFLSRERVNKGTNRISG